MRYHYEKPSIYLSLYGKLYICDHPVYNACILFQIGDKGLAVIQQRFDLDTKNTWWSEVDPWLIVDGMKRRFLTKTARSQLQSISCFRDPFKLVPVTELAEIADKFRENRCRIYFPASRPKWSDCTVL